MSGFDRRFETKPDRVRRFEVITGEAGRRPWPDHVKSRIVAESLAPDAVVSVIARRHGLRPQQLFAWRRLAREGRLALPEPEFTFAPVVVAAGEPKSGTPSSAEPLPVPSFGDIEIVFGDAIVRLKGEIHSNRLAMVLDALRRVR